MDTDLAKLHHDVVFGQSGGRIIWQPRIGCWYTDKVFAGEPLPAPYDGLPIEDIYRRLGCSHRLYSWFNRCFKCVEHPSVRRVERQIDDRDTEIAIETPAGRQIAITRKTESSSRTIHAKREIATEDELKVLFDPAAADGGTWAQRFEQVYCAPDFAEREPERSQWLFQLVRSTPRDPALVGAAVARTPPEAYLGRFGCPALLLYGAEDRIGHRRNAEDLHRQCPKSKLVYVQDAGHFVIAEQPERFAEEVLIWVEEAGL